MAERSGDRFGKMFANQLCAEARESREVTSADSTEQRRRSRTSKRSVVIDCELFVGLIEAENAVCLVLRSLVERKRP